MWYVMNEWETKKNNVSELEKTNLKLPIVNALYVQRYYNTLHSQTMTSFIFLLFLTRQMICTSGAPICPHILACM